MNDVPAENGSAFSSPGNLTSIKRSSDTTNLQEGSIEPKRQRALGPDLVGFSVATQDSVAFPSEGSPDLECFNYPPSQSPSIEPETESPDTGNSCADASSQILAAPAPARIPAGFRNVNLPAKSVPMPIYKTAKSAVEDQSLEQALSVSEPTCPVTPLAETVTHSTTTTAVGKAKVDKETPTNLLFNEHALDESSENACDPHGKLTDQGTTSPILAPSALLELSAPSLSQSLTASDPGKSSMLKEMLTNNALIELQMSSVEVSELNSALPMPSSDDGGTEQSSANASLDLATAAQEAMAPPTHLLAHDDHGQTFSLTFDACKKTEKADGTVEGAEEGADLVKATEAKDQHSTALTKEVQEVALDTEEISNVNETSHASESDLSTRVVLSTNGGGVELSSVNASLDLATAAQEAMAPPTHLLTSDNQDQKSSFFLDAFEKTEKTDGTVEGAEEGADLVKATVAADQHSTALIEEVQEVDEISHAPECELSTRVVLSTNGSGFELSSVNASLDLVTTAEEAIAPPMHLLAHDDHGQTSSLTFDAFETTEKTNGNVEGAEKKVADLEVKTVATDQHSTAPIKEVQEGTPSKRTFSDIASNASGVSDPQKEQVAEVDEKQDGTRSEIGVMQDDLLSGKLDVETLLSNADLDLEENSKVNTTSHVCGSDPVEMSGSNSSEEPISNVVWEPGGEKQVMHLDDSAIMQRKKEPDIEKRVMETPAVVTPAKSNLELDFTHAGEDMCALRSGSVSDSTKEVDDLDLEKENTEDGSSKEGLEHREECSDESKLHHLDHQAASATTVTPNPTASSALQTQPDEIFPPLSCDEVADSEQPCLKKQKGGTVLAVEEEAYLGSTPDEGATSEQPVSTIAPLSSSTGAAVLGEVNTSSLVTPERTRSGPSLESIAASLAYLRPSSETLLRSATTLTARETPMQAPAPSSTSSSLLGQHCSSFNTTVFAMHPPAALSGRNEDATPSHFALTKEASPLSTCGTGLTHEHETQEHIYDEDGNTGNQGLPSSGSTTRSPLDFGFRLASFSGSFSAPPSMYGGSDCSGGGGFRRGLGRRGMSVKGLGSELGENINENDDEGGPGEDVSIALLRVRHRQELDWQARMMRDKFQAELHQERVRVADAVMAKAETVISAERSVMEKEFAKEKEGILTEAAKEYQDQWQQLQSTMVASRDSALGARVNNFRDDWNRRNLTTANIGGEHKENLEVQALLLALRAQWSAESEVLIKEREQAVTDHYTKYLKNYRQEIQKEVEAERENFAEHAVTLARVEWDRDHLNQALATVPAPVTNGLGSQSFSSGESSQNF